MRPVLLVWDPASTNQCLEISSAPSGRIRADILRGICVAARKPRKPPRGVGPDAIVPPTADTQTQQQSSALGNEIKRMKEIIQDAYRRNDQKGPLCVCGAIS